MHKLQIQAVGQPEIYQGDGFQVWTYLCQGTVDGMMVPQLIIRTGSETIAQQIQPGWTGEGEQEIIKGGALQGQVAYKVRAAKKPFSGGGGFRKPTYTLAEYDALFAHAAGRAQASLPQEASVSAEVHADCFCRLLASYIISATDAGVKVGGQAQPMAPAVPPAATPPATGYWQQQPQPEAQPMAQAQPMAPAPQAQPELGVDDDVIVQAIRAAGLEERCNQAGFSFPQLRQWWADAGGQPNMFAVRLNREIRDTGTLS